MKNRFFLFISVFSLLFSLMPSSQAAEPVSDLAARFDAFAASIFQEDAPSDTLTQLLEPALSGLEDTVYFYVEDAVTSAIFNADLFRTWFLDVLPMFLSHMESTGQTRLLAGGDVGWHEYTLDYHARLFSWNDTPDIGDDREVSHLLYRQNVSCTPNRCDEILAVMVGSARVRMQIEKGPVGFSHITYRLNITVSDDFDFDGNYDEEKDQGFDTDFSDQMNDLGSLWGLHAFTWYACADFDITVPNSCAHTVPPESGSTCPLCGADDNAKPAGPVPGDADGDEVLTFNDALLVLRASIGLDALAPEITDACDLDGDNILTYNDALTILRRSIGLA